MSPIFMQAFGNAKTAHNNNSSRFGKFIQVSYLESGIVRGMGSDESDLESPVSSHIWWWPHNRPAPPDSASPSWYERIPPGHPLPMGPWTAQSLQASVPCPLLRSRHAGLSACRSIAVVEKYLLEKSRLVSQEKDERNYHVFYYLLLGVSEEERREFQLKQPEDYFYLNQHNLKIEDGEDLKHDFERLKQAMEMVGFLPATKKQIFAVLSAILYLGNVTYKKRATGREEGLEVGPPEVLDTLSQLLKPPCDGWEPPAPTGKAVSAGHQAPPGPMACTHMRTVYAHTRATEHQHTASPCDVKREILVEVLTKRKTVTVNDKLILPYSLSEAITARDSMAKSLYSALFDWIVLRINHALLNKKDVEEAVSCLSIGVLDIFGFEDFERNSFEQFCINYANEQLQYYFNQHIFKLEQEEYQGEGITWHNIGYTDNVGCIHLISKKPTGLFYLLDEESNEAGLR
ncbi:Unconventional myosin-IXb [Saguinus oedipus]|uniref:Unconventional myosin-IXb n=1 Tax=Saguinus oedipus TaxID=9490 RepID=A0ABQ9TS82_SAGOE|nr:Unconventional myosin-IXb [Saguinus oedipus]